jgi:hypothetical protein
LRAIFCCFGSFSVAPCVYSYVIEFFGLFISQRGWCSLDCWCLEFGCEYFFSVSCSEDSLACVQFFVVLVVSVLLHVCIRMSLNFSDYLFLSLVGVRWIVGVLNSVVNIFFLSPVPRILWLACNFLLFW